MIERINPDHEPEEEPALASPKCNCSCGCSCTCPTGDQATVHGGLYPSTHAGDFEGTMNIQPG